MHLNTPEAQSKHKHGECIHGCLKYLRAIVSAGCASVAGVGLQVLQQLAGINTVMYYTPAILELAGIHGNRLALLV